MCTKTDIKNEWGISVAKNLQQIEAIREIWGKKQNEQVFPDLDSDIDRYISVFEPQSDTVQPYVILLSHNGNVETEVVGRISKYSIPCKIGYKTIFKPSLRCLTIDGIGLLGRTDKVVADVISNELLNALRKGDMDVILFNYVKVDTPIYKIARTKPSFLCREYFPITVPHFYCTVPDSIDLFYEKLKTKDRNDFKRKIKKLENQFPNQVKIITYRNENELNEAITIASQISRKTYQYAMGVGFENNTQMYSKLSTAAHKGWLHLSILYINEEPCAFQLGLLYRKTFFIEQIGYDPAWRQYSVGTYLFLKYMQELCTKFSPRLIDFGPGDADYKRIYCDIKLEVASLYIFACRPIPICINVMYSMTSGFSLVIQMLMQKLGILPWLKRQWRDRLRQKNTDK